MSLELIRRAELTAQQVAELERAMAAFYRNPLAAYYQTANEAFVQCSPKDTPFHFDLCNPPITHLMRCDMEGREKLFLEVYELLLGNTERGDRIPHVLLGPRRVHHQIEDGWPDAAASHLRESIQFARESCSTAIIQKRL